MCEIIGEVMKSIEIKLTERYYNDGFSLYFLRSEKYKSLSPH
jgi:hypothetical protein